MFGNLPPFFSPFPYGPSPSSGTASTKFVDLFNTQTVAGAKTFTDTTTFNKTADSTEELINMTVSDDAAASLKFRNFISSAGTFVPTIQGTGPASSGASRHALVLTARLAGAHDSGSESVGVFNTYASPTSATAITTRPLWTWFNGPNNVLSALPLNSGANLALSWGTQTAAAPAFTTRSAGTRVILFSAVGASDVDYALGVGATGLWYSVARATSIYDHRWYGGTTNVMTLRGDGLLQTTGARVKKLRVATTTPITAVAGTDEIIISKLAAPGAVAVSLPATPATGLTYVIKDGTGDAAANNITITPAAGTIDGAATLVIATNYGKVTLTYSGTEWLSI